jgi:hypothetical protein
MAALLNRQKPWLQFTVREGAEENVAVACVRGGRRCEAGRRGVETVACQRGSTAVWSSTGFTQQTGQSFL